MEMGFKLVNGRIGRGLPPGAHFVPLGDTTLQNFAQSEPGRTLLHSRAIQLLK